jgi:hypothetical protein
MTKLKNQSAFTHTAEFGGEKAGGEAGGELDMLELFGSAIA